VNELLRSMAGLSDWGEELWAVDACNPCVSHHRLHRVFRTSRRPGQRAASSGIPCTRANQTPTTHGLKARLPPSFRSGTSIRHAELVGLNLEHDASPMDQAGAKHSLSPVDAEVGAVIEITRFPSCRVVHRKMYPWHRLYLQFHSPILTTERNLESTLPLSSKLTRHGNE
jgi:hypothetical protein